MPAFHALPVRQRGFTLVELMVASAIGLAILAAMATLFLSNSNAQAEIERANRQVENGRFALQLIGADLRSAGFLSQLDPTVLDLPTALPDACATDLPAIRGALPLHVQGLDGTTTLLDCIKDEGLKAGTDVLVVRRTASCVIGAVNCEAVADGGPFFQASLCGADTELGSVDTTNYYALDVTTAPLLRHKHDCKTLADVRRFLTRIYFVADHDKTGDGVPTLKRADLVSDGTSSRFVVTSQVNGVENLQLEYGIDTNNDGTPDVYSADPAKAAGCTAAGCAVANWMSVMSVKVNVLARSSDPTKGYVDTKTYDLGMKANGDANTVAASNDSYKRHVFQSLAALPNPAGRRVK